METDGGGWTVFQRRQDGSVDFKRNWVSYEKGFGNLTGEHWLGLSKMHHLTQGGSSNTLRIEIQSFDGQKAYAQYSVFNIGNVATQYMLSIGGHSGTAPDDLASYNGHRFATYDNDYKNCISAWNNNGWWYHNGCFWTILNGDYGQNVGGWNGIFWYGWNGTGKLKFVEMKTRRQT